MEQERSPDGRHARREKSRQAIIEAMFALVREGKGPPEVEDVAERAGVSVSSVFRNFDGLADLQQQALQSFQTKYPHLFVVDDAEDPLALRIRSHVKARIAVAEEVGQLMRIARGRAVDHQVMVKNLATFRGRMADQTRRRFANEIHQLTPAEAANLSALIDALTSLEAHEVMAAAHARTNRQIAKVWTAALEAVLEPWLAVDTETPS